MHFNTGMAYTNFSNLKILCSRLSSKQHCKVPGRLHQQGYRGFYYWVSWCLFPVPSRLSVFHPEFHSSSSEHSGSTTKTGHIWVLIHPCGAYGWSSLWTGYKSELQRLKCKTVLKLLLLLQIKVELGAGRERLIQLIVFYKTPSICVDTIKCLDQLIFSVMDMYLIVDLYMFCVL